MDSSYGGPGDQMAGYDQSNQNEQLQMLLLQQLQQGSEPSNDRRYGEYYSRGESSRSGFDRRGNVPPEMGGGYGSSRYERGYSQDDYGGMSHGQRGDDPRDQRRAQDLHRQQMLEQQQARLAAQKEQERQERLMQQQEHIRAQRASQMGSSWSGQGSMSHGPMVGGPKR
ncbi:hypothetical protein GUITHDRAFT_119410 [Guillardia theta CCMP2712]|uniref:Uncharacterized protein n=1 Tax=Guillardia theta (strain CCMP2712) TaxID=905079 RepID=L1IDV5_GUITC|nr:hypothetical protein GUITHDRAFT_119410 [Guillardia theta CCMP2712]EKX34408.1 hypothetical protein GUITHDRAFT_119410 [Guillardia theta CCMP2712]|eukprot:XP_005821388.1 hypothetical protein GUITHDRAFT_119410 [Guillardia theta CCMP2712]